MSIKDKNIKLQIWDTAGQVRKFHSDKFVSILMRDSRRDSERSQVHTTAGLVRDVDLSSFPSADGRADGIVVVYDITNKCVAAFDRVETDAHWLGNLSIT